jgi:polysaccharide deacetylase family protein (PEP-CTERM system associated)
VITGPPRHGTYLSDVVNAMTIDVEEHFHVSVFDGLIPRSRWPELESRVCANTEKLLGIFSEAGVTATFFVLGCVAERFPLLVRTIAGMGHEIASHGYGHRLVYDQTPAAFREDVRRAKRLLEQASRGPVVGYRAPSYSVTPRSLWALDILIEEGYQYDASIFPIRHDRYGIPLSPRHAYVVRRAAGTMFETPASTARWAGLNVPVAGGGYFRILPYAWTRWGIRRINCVEGRAAIFYMHPWEIDPDQPRLPVAALSRFRHYHNLHCAEARLKQLLREFRFAAMNAIPWTLRNGEPATESYAERLPYLW